MSDTISLTREEVAVLLRAPNFDAYEKVSKRLVAFDRSEPAPADNVVGSEDWAATWHKTVQTICTIIGINGNGGPEEILAELQAKSSESARAKRLQAALGHEGVYIHDATAERAIRAALATATPETKP